MLQELEALLATLDNKLLRMLPCFYDDPHPFWFRIGEDEGPQIKFYQETTKQYHLSIQDREKNQFVFPINIETEHFKDARAIYYHILNLYNDKDYDKCLKNTKIYPVLLSNLQNIVHPILLRLETKIKR